MPSTDVSSDPDSPDTIDSSPTSGSTSSEFKDSEIIRISHFATYVTIRQQRLSNPR